MTLGWVALGVLVFGVLAFQRAAATVWAIGLAVYLLLLTSFGACSSGALVALWVSYAVLGSLIWIPSLRLRLLTRWVVSIYRRSMPTLSKTEKEALSAGGVGFERQFFTGMPDWSMLQSMPRVRLTAEEQAFLDGPVEQLCSMIDSWKITYQSHAIPQEVWDHLKKHGFFSLIIPKAYGGKAFSALAHSQIIHKVAGVSGAVATVMSVPNSLGPAELLLVYGTEQQKDYYLPRLARGEEIPCFALTSPVAGSDAGSIEDHGVVCKRVIDGQEQIGICLNWNKRYITLAPVATLLGLAFKLYDPDHLLGAREDIGITCALIPVSTPGVVTGRRHYPLCSQFPNGPTQGKDVFIPLDSIIGGVKMAGAGWRMLMECLAAGRAISLPSTALGGAKPAFYASGAYARIRRQFNVPIGSFGGIQEALARVGGYTYLAEALRLMGVCAIDNDYHSSVASAISKYHTTEYSRKIVNDAMDIHGGKGICMGPANYLAQAYIESPIAITVEGANILTRSMIIFGQGAIRCHPFILTEMLAVQDTNLAQGLKTFDRAFFQHLGMVISNHVRAIVLALSGGRLASVPKGTLVRDYQKLARYSAAFALVADMAMFTIGAKLKRKERLSARLGDMLSYLFNAAAIIKYYELQEQPELAIVHRWAFQYLEDRLQQAFHEFLINMPNRWLAGWLRAFIFPVGRRCKGPRDRLGKQLAEMQLSPTKMRTLLADKIYLGEGKAGNAMLDIDRALEAVLRTEPLYQKVQAAKRAKRIHAMTYQELLDAAVVAGELTANERDQLWKAHQLSMKIIDVDDFSDAELHNA